jgi:xanthine/uracil permease
MRLPPFPAWHRKHREEMLKLLASGLQLFVLAIFAGAVLAPILNSSLRMPTWGYVGALALMMIAEGTALTLLRYIEPEPAPHPQQETTR